MTNKATSRNEFMKDLRKDKMVDMMDMVIDSLKEELTEMQVYDYFKEELGKGRKYDNFTMLEGSLDNLTSEIELDDGGEEVSNIIMKNFFSYWLSDLTMKQNMMSQNAFDYAGLCKEELSQHMDFYELLRLIKNLDENKESLLSFLKENWSEEIEDEISDIKEIIDYQNLYPEVINYVTGNLKYEIFNN